MRALVLACSATFLIGAQADHPAERALDAAMTGFAPAADRPGCAVGVIDDARLAFARGYGAADIGTGRAITPETPFNLASMSKSVTAAAVALLVEDGRIGLDDDIRRWLPELPDYGPNVRIRHLLHHTSGLRNHMALAALQPGAPLPSHEQALALVFRQSALNFEPGSRHQYESPNYVLLAEIVARASGTSFERFLADRIFAPLGMRNTGFAVPGTARAYAPNPAGGFTLTERVNGARGSSNLVSTLNDFATWLIALDRDRLAPGLMARMTAGTRLNDGTRLDYGYGLAVSRDFGDVPGLVTIGHGGQTAAWRSQFVYVPGRGFGAIMLCNVSNAPLQAVRQAVAAWVEARSFPARPPAPPAAQPLAAGEAARFAGVWLDPAADEIRQFAVADGQLVFIYGGRPYPLTHLGGGRFALGDLGGFAFAGDSMVETGPGQPAIRFVRLPPAGPVAVADYAGRYRSNDVDGELAIGGGDRLVLTAPFGEMPLDPIHPDGFAAVAAGIGRVAFSRGRDGRVTGLTVTTLSGINRMRFERAR